MEQRFIIPMSGPKPGEIERDYRFHGWLALALSAVGAAVLLLAVSYFSS